MEGADIVCCTLSGAAAAIKMCLRCPIKTVVIDEAAQSVEASCLVPLQASPSRCVLFGDPRQLPATTFSRDADATRYSRSLFERLQEGGHGAHVLSVQYRMHPQIRQFPSDHFYSGLLTDGRSEGDAPWHAHPLFPPVV
eukprot:CAMPEP_0173452884 /NCGR_PEP_ID=MMETSP1357-20121228/49601_1 /TAXON_ID=77926 /ORGANISM="Hemiselmis rufescens, Strain PCC563" /LENGTH=138 /DNA_ID=CAMNT_0014419797 /DNA_START=24 /DNA_END=437 /DNA_ORIENTATION=-